MPPGAHERATPSGIHARTAIFGGTFDPVHNAHIEIARAAADRFGLAKVLFVPAANPPHKTDQAVASYEDRVNMLELACGADARFAVSRIEAPRVEESASPSYTILTIRKLLQAGSGPLAFLIGADAFADIRTWYRWQEVVLSVEFIVVTRIGSRWNAPEGALVHELTGIESTVSSSAVRVQIASGALEVPLPVAVLEYIRSHRLYNADSERKCC